jgi:hypothetical protein
VCGAVLSAAGRQGRARTWLLVVLASAAVLGPAEQAWLETQAVLNQHVGLGAWFTAIAAGYAADRFIAFARPGRHEALTATACVTALVFPVALGASQSRMLATSWPNATSLIAILRPLAAHGHGRLLVEDPAVARYYLPQGAQWRRWSSTRTIVTPSGAITGARPGIVAPGDPAVFHKYIAEGYFSYVALNFADTTALDHGLATELHHNPRYRIIQVVPYATEAHPAEGTYVIWKLLPAR